jgi:hypothetical protein
MLIEIMKKIFTISVLFLLAFIFSPKTTFAQGTYSCLWVTTSIGCVPKGVSCEDGFITDCSGLSATECNSAQNLNCISKDKPVIKGPLEGCGGEAINTAIGCIPIGNTDEFTSFILRWAIGVGGGIAFLLIVFAGFQIMTSAGNPERLQAGRELLTSAIAGLILLIFSVFILRIIGVNILGIFKP